MKTTILFIFLVSTNIIFGQSEINTRNRLKRDTVLDSKLCLKFAPLSLLGIYTGPSIRLGVEYELKNTWSLYNELGYFIGNRGGIAKFELKNYLDDLDKNVGTYVSVELAYKYQQYQTKDTIAKINQANLQITKYEKNYTVTKHVECLTIKYGVMKVYRYRILIDAFVGVGIRIKQATNGLTDNENENIKHSSDYGPNVFTNKAGNSVYPNIDLGVKIGYRIK